MRTALLSAIERTPEGTLRAFLAMGGRPVIAWQLDLAIKLGCERVACLCEGTTPELIDLQRQAESAGLRFNLVRGPLQLVGLVSADHEIVALADGLMIDPALATGLVANQRGIAALPADRGISAGFERIDADHAWGGILAARGNIVERLADLPPDSDAIALLLRLALQAGTKRLELDNAALDSGELILASSADKVDERERALLDSSTAAVSWAGPGRALARLLARRLVPGALQKGPTIALGLSAALSAAAIALAAMGNGAIAVPLLALGAFTLATMQALRSIKQKLLGKEVDRKTQSIINALFDIVIIAVLTLPTAAFMLPRRVFLPLVLIGVLRVVAQGAKPACSALLSDRTLLLVLLVPAAVIGVPTMGMAWIIVAALAFAVISGARNADNGELTTLR